MADKLTLGEIRARAVRFSREWKGEKHEAAEKQSFWNDFFEVFGIHRRRYAAYEVPVKLREGRRGKIDLFWPGVVLVEHKSAGEDLSAAFKQAADYFDGIPDKDLPKYVIVSDFARFRTYNTEGGEPVEFPIEKLHLNIGVFGFLTGHAYRRYEASPEADAKAARHMARLHAALSRNGYTGHPLAVLLVRLMFCLFADKTGIFSPPDLFRDIIERKTSEDGADVGPLLMQVFAVLDTPKNRRQRTLDPDLKELEYVNGHLFEERFDPPAFDKSAREMLLKCLAFDWSAVSPAIFGAMFQGVMDEKKGKRREIGAHYTSEKNILKAIRPLIIDPLRAELDSASSERSLEALLKKIGNTKVLDPACGCGNFLVIAYRELRQLEIDTYLKLRKVRGRDDERLLSVAFAQRLDVDAMHGIEIEDFPCRIAETGLYIMDHVMNNRAEDEIGPNFRRLPLAKTPRITCGNALRLDWSKVVPVERLSCIVGNPPFVGKKARSKEQVKDMDIVFHNWNGHGELDYVSAWYVKAIRIIRGTSVPVAFVSTNSLTQGEQVAIFWPTMLREGLRIHFAHRTFRWDNDAPGEASVYCVIIGWGLEEPTRRILFDYETPTSEPMAQTVRRINPYLVDFEDVFVTARSTPLSDAPAITFGSMPNDDGNFLFTEQERREFLRVEPDASELFRPIMSAKEFLNGTPRWCLWLKGVSPSVVRALPRVKERVERVRTYREASKRKATRKLAATPALFGEIRQPDLPYILIPRHSSELRQYIPMAMLTPDKVASDSCLVVHSEDLYVFGVLQSTMHMAWMRQVCGRIKSDFRYSNEIVYNNFPWPDAPTDTRKDAVRAAARGLLDARAQQAGQSLADLYDVDVMPAVLLKAHRELDRSVDACYGQRVFDSEPSRIRYLLEKYASLIAAGQASLDLPIPKRSKRVKNPAK